MKKLFLTYLLLFTLTAINAQEKEQKLFLSGYVKNLHEFSFIDKLDQLQWTTLLHNRLNFKYLPSEAITVRIELRNRLFYGDNVKNIFGFSQMISIDNGITDLSWNIVDNKDILFNTTIDRALVNYTKGNWDITLGRQRVNWGMNLVWNPNDIFNTYNILDFDYEERPGSDAARIQYYLDDFSKLEFSAKKGRGKDDYIVATMYKFNKWLYDIQLITGVYQKDWVIGTGWAGNLKNAGFKGEISYFVPYKTYLNAKNIVSSSIAVDYGFKKGLYINGSLLYNSNANATTNRLDNLMYSNLNAKNLMPFKYSGFVQLSKEISPIFFVSMSTIYSPTKHSLITIPSFNYSIATDWEFNFTAQSFFEFEKYQAIENRLFFRVRWSF
ncbi:hypothetical protein [Lutibacter sp.]|uniref:hypothetical protein n=1 Tax=Lutibacter sp. TaxID=1925666 RepID=UPI00356973E8